MIFIRRRNISYPWQAAFVDPEGRVKEKTGSMLLVYEGAEEMEINPSDEEQMAKMFTCYLLAGSMDGYGEFVDYALDTTGHCSRT